MANEFDQFDTAASAANPFDQFDAVAAPAGSYAPPSTLAVAANAPYKGLASVADMFLNTPTNIANLGIAGYGAIKGALGGTDLPNTMATPDYARRGMEQVGLIRSLPNMTAQQRILDAGIQASTAGLLGSPGTAARNAFLGLTGGLAGQTTTEVTGSPEAGLAASMLTPAGLAKSAATRQAGLQAAQTRNAVRDQTLRAAQQEGLKVTPGSVSNSPAKVFLEHIAGKSGTEQVASVQNQQQIDRLARRAIGVAEDAPLTINTTRDVRREAYAQGYEPIVKVGPMSADADFATALDNTIAQHTGAGGSFANAIPDDVAKVVAAYRVPGFDSKDAIKAIQSLRDKAGGHYKSGNHDLANAERSIATALENQIERNLASTGSVDATEMLARFKQARQRMAISHTVEDAIHVGTGSVDARMLAKDIQSGKYLSDDLKTIAEFSNTFKNVTKFPSGTPGASGHGYGAIGAGGVMIPIGYSLGGPLGGAAATAGALVAPALARRYLLSEGMQRRAIPNYDPITNALVGGGPAGSLGAVATQLNQNAMRGQ
jgi:hypothetical protein